MVLIESDTSRFAPEASTVVLDRFRTQQKVYKQVVYSQSRLRVPPVRVDLLQG